MRNRSWRNISTLAVIAALPLLVVMARETSAQVAAQGVNEPFEMSPTSGPPGTEVTVWNDFEDVDSCIQVVPDPLTFYFHDMEVAEVQQGSPCSPYETSFRIPDGTSPGTYLVEVTAAETECAEDPCPERLGREFEVTAATSTPESPTETATPTMEASDPTATPTLPAPNPPDTGSGEHRAGGADAFAAVSVGVLLVFLGTGFLLLTSLRNSRHR